MKLFYRAASPFSRKVRIIAREVGVVLDEIAVDDTRVHEALHAANPVARAPVLILDDGSSLVDSRVICEYLNARGGGKFFPGNSIWTGDAGKWRSLGLAALADGIAESVIAVFKERRLAETERRADLADYETGRVVAGLDALERMAPRFAEFPTIGEVGVGCLLGYVDLRLADLDWRASRPHLSAWFETFSRYPSVQATVPK